MQLRGFCRKHISLRPQPIGCLEATEGGKGMEKGGKHTVQLHNQKFQKTPNESTGKVEALQRFI